VIDKVLSDENKARSPENLFRAFGFNRSQAFRLKMVERRNGCHWMA
jgi:hypothetical protein